MPKYEVNLYYTGFVTTTVKAENKEEALEKARNEKDSPGSQDTFTRRFERILETLEAWKECDTGKLKTECVKGP